MTLRPCPIGFFCIPDKLVGDGSGRKGRIFARFVKLLYYKKISRDFYKIQKTTWRNSLSFFVFYSAFSFSSFNLYSLNLFSFCIVLVSNSSTHTSRSIAEIYDPTGILAIAKIAKTNN